MIEDIKKEGRKEDKRREGGREEIETQGGGCMCMGEWGSYARKEIQ